jgi:hypothetical protein
MRKYNIDKAVWLRVDFLRYLPKMPNETAQLTDKTGKRLKEIRWGLIYSMNLEQRVDRHSSSNTGTN